MDESRDDLSLAMDLVMVLFTTEVDDEVDVLCLDVDGNVHEMLLGCG